MQHRHTNRNLYFCEQEYTTNKYIIPLIEKILPFNSHHKILEIGCGEGGNLKPFLDKNLSCTGIDISENKVINGQKMYIEHPYKDNLKLLCVDIFDYVTQPNHSKFDVIILRDVIEHICFQKKLIEILPQLMTSEGLCFLGFPPWLSPFAGHQQMCKSILSKIPFIQLLPTILYRKLLFLCKESSSTTQSLIELKDSKLTIGTFEKIIKQSKLTIVFRKLYFINPNYEIKFKLKPRKVIFPFSSIPYIKNFYTTTAYYILKSNSFSKENIQR